jgi:hypothetical protein
MTLCLSTIHFSVFFIEYQLYQCLTFSCVFLVNMLMFVVNDMDYDLYFDS